MKICLLVIASILLLPIFTSFEAEASHNQHLVVSAENSDFDNHFSGSMVIEVVINDPDFNEVGEAEGEPDVSLNGDKLRMVQATDGKWYAYFANLDAAKKADQIVLNAGPGAVGESLDFGVFCSSTTDVSVLGASFSNTEGVAVPRATAGSTDGQTAFAACTAAPAGPIINNVVRNPKGVNSNPSVPTGQIGIDSNAWPIIQLFSFDDVEIKYNRSGGTQSVQLEYDDMVNISFTTDRSGYPNNAEVFFELMDMQLNQDPTDEDSWTFNINSTETAFYQAFTESGSDSANNTPGLINLIPHLSSLDFDENGMLTFDLGNIAELKTNKKQPSSFVSDTTNTYSQIITIVESKPNSATFQNYDTSFESTVGILSNAPRGQSAVFTYNDEATSILSGSVTASISLDAKGSQFEAGTEAIVTVVDSDQNVNSGERDDFEVFRSSAIIPTLVIGEPVTLNDASGVKFYPDSGDALAGGTAIPSDVPDDTEARLILDTTASGTTTIEKIAFNLGITAGTLQSLFIDVNVNNDRGTNWINYDLTSFEEQLEIDSFSDTSMTLHFGGLPGATQVQIVDPGDISSARGLEQIDEADITTISGVASSSSVFLEINFDSAGIPGFVGQIDDEEFTQPIIFDLFSFGLRNSDDQVNNAIYRFELEETARNSGIFVGTVEYTVTNQVNIFDPNLITSLRTIDDRIKFLVNDRLIDEEGINIAYSDVDDVGLTISTSAKTDIKTNSGTVSFTSNTYRFGQPVYFVLNDPDLNLKHDRVETYQVVNDPNSPNVDTVGTAGGDILVEILIKDIRYKRCTINGVQHGGLASTGFALVEQGPNSGVFQGSFKMPSEICNKSGTELISTAGGSLDAKYHDFRDSSGEQNIFSFSKSGTTSSSGYIPPTLSSDKILVPKYKQTSDVVLSGTVDNYIQGTTLDIILVGPDKSSEKISVYATKNGEYKVVLTLNDKSLTGKYLIDVNYRGQNAGDTSFQVSKHLVAEWIKNNARWWASDQISDSEFISGIEHLIQEKIIVIPDSIKSDKADQNIPFWIKNTAEWWSQDIVSDDEFVAALEFLVKNGIIRI